MKLAGITLVANGIDLGYPFKACIYNLWQCCDQVFVATDKKNKDNTLQSLEGMSEAMGRVTIIETEWNWGITNGRDLALRANHCLDRAEAEGYDYALYVQADEIVNPKEIELLKYTADHTWLNFAIERTYFWKDLRHINKDWTMHLPRMCTITPDLRVAGDGMSMSINQKLPLIFIDPHITRIYHYSRVGESKEIAQRLNNLDLMFHTPQEFQPLKDYIFGSNNNYEQGVPEARIEYIQIEHPPHVLDFYKEHK